jgi:hypothetical protein
VPPNKRKVRLPDGREVDAVIVPFQTGGEHWNEYLCDDGSIVRLKPVVTEILRIEGEYDQQGNPIYRVQNVNVTHVIAAESQRKGGDSS